jgi:hypothetical protein
VSTFLVTVLVVAMSIAAAVTLALNDPDQPATLRIRKRRERRAPRPPANRPRHASRPAPASTPTAGPLLTPGGGRRSSQAPAPAGGLATAVAPTVEVAGLSDYWAPARRVSVWVRIRSGFVLTVLLAVLGALVAAAVAGFVIFVALAVRSAVG